MGEAAPPFPEVARLPPALLEELREYIDTRIGEGRTRAGDLDPDVVGKLERDLERRLEARAKLLISPEALDAKVTEVLSRRPPPPAPDARSLLSGDMKGALAEVVDALVARRLSEGPVGRAPRPAPMDPGTLDERLAELLSGKGSDQRTLRVLEQRIQGLVSRAAEADRKSTDDRLDEVLKELHVRSRAQVELEATIRSEVRFLDEKLQTLMGRMIPLLRRTWLKIDELEKRPVSGTGTSERKMKQLRDELWGEMRRLELDLSERTRLILDRVEGNVQNQGRLWLTLVSQLSSLAEQRRELERIVHESKEDFEPSGAESAEDASPVRVEGEPASDPAAGEETPDDPDPKRGDPKSDASREATAPPAKGRSKGH